MPSTRLLELVVLIAERELGAFAPHGLRDSPRDRAIAREPDDDRALACEETHQPLCSVTSTNIVRRWPGCRYLSAAPAFHSTSLPTDTLKRRAIDDKRIAAAHDVRDLANAVGRGEARCRIRALRAMPAPWSPHRDLRRRVGPDDELAPDAEHVARRHRVPAREAAHIHVVRARYRPERLAGSARRARAARRCAACSVAERHGHRRSACSSRATAWRAGSSDSRRRGSCCRAAR